MAYDEAISECSSNSESKHSGSSFYAENKTNLIGENSEQDDDDEEEDIASALGYSKETATCQMRNDASYLSGRKRLSKKNTPPDLWIAHKKQRKKIASAKWYAKKQAVVKAKESKKLEKKQLSGRYAALNTPPEHNPYSYQFQPTEEEKQELRCKWEHQLNGWPVRNPAVPPDKWLAIIDLAKECVDRMNYDPVQDAHKLALCKRLCVEELKHEFLKWGGTDQSMSDIRTRCNTPVSPPESSSSSWADRAKFALTQGWFPTVCTTAGLFWIQCILRGQKHLWPALVRHVYPLNRMSTNILPIQEGHHPEMNTPHHMPSTNACDGVQN